MQEAKRRKDDNTYSLLDIPSSSTQLQIIILLYINISFWFVINRMKWTSNYRTRVQTSKAFYRMKTELQWQFLSFHVTCKQQKGASDLFGEERRLKFRKLRVLNIALSTILSFGNHSHKSYCSAIFKYFLWIVVNFFSKNQHRLLQNYINSHENASIYIIIYCLKKQYSREQ